MSSYGKKCYWNERYAREEQPCDWLVSSYGVFQHLFTPTFLSNTTAPPPGGVITIRRLVDFEQEHRAHVGHRPMATGDFLDEEARQHPSPPTSRGVWEFPPKEKARVLHVGCGTSQLGESMLHDGFTDIVNVDWSDVVIQKMQQWYSHDFYRHLGSVMEREELLRSSLGLPGVEARDDHSQMHARTPKMTFDVGDICEGLPHSDETFDLIVMKKTLDVILCGAGSTTDARHALSECFRLLNKDHGVLLVISSAKPEDRAVFFENDPWSGILNIKLPCAEDYGQFQHKGHEKKRADSYAYLLYKQGWRSVQAEDL
ncbi:hypothetical protein ACHAXT_011552 [Thalassiosira profunda]